ncbi:MAG: mechanosensitive ion channel [candidate division Zixibacteria bacterium]|nr:mechanosensitive ion channel [candidate division Zixibacteria bacterium]
MMELVNEILSNEWFLAGSIILAALVFGIIFEIMVIRTLRRLAKNTQWEWDDVLIHAFKRIFVILFIIGGIYFSTLYVDMQDKYREILNKSIVALLIFALTMILARVLAGFIQLYSRKSTSGLPSTTLLSNIAALLVIITGAIIILQNLGVSITPLITALGVGSLAVALALQDTLSNLFAGFQIIVNKQIRPGDFIQLDTGEEGYVTDVKWRNTTIRSLRSTRVFIVPNSKVSSAIVTNYNLPRELVWYRVYVGVAYDSDLDQVEKATREVATEAVSAMYPDNFPHKPVVRFREFGDSSINLSCRLPVRRYLDIFKLRSEFIKRLHKRYNQEGIEIPFPIRTVYMRNTDESQNGVED